MGVDPLTTTVAIATRACYRGTFSNHPTVLRPARIGGGGGRELPGCERWLGGSRALGGGDRPPPVHHTPPPYYMYGTHMALSTIDIYASKFLLFFSLLRSLNN
jgi:hypothetical protein